MDGEKTVLICEDSMDGIFTAVYDGWREGAKGRPVEVHTREPWDLELFCNYIKITTDQEKAGKVMGTIRQKLGMRTYEDICYAAVSTHPDRGTAIYYVLRQALAGGRCNARIMEALADPHVNMVSRLRVKVWHEIHRYFGFVRFQDLGGVLFSKIKPENDILEMLGPHFANRFPGENWMIYDEGRGKVLLHAAGGECILRRGVTLEEAYGDKLAGKDIYEELWKVFRKSITIEERANEALMQQLLPLKFRSNMVEFTVEAPPNV